MRRGEEEQGAEPAGDHQDLESTGAAGRSVVSRCPFVEALAGGGSDAE